MKKTIAEYLQTQSLFHGVPQGELDGAAGLMEWVDLHLDEIVIKESSIGHDCFFIVEGTVQVYTRNLIGKPVLLAELGPGNIIGDIALLMNERRNANVRASTEVKAIRLQRQAFEVLSKASPLFHESLKVSAEIRYIHTLLRKASIWSAIPDSELRGLAEITVRRQVKKGDMVIREGDETEQLYMITSGRFEMRSKGKRKAWLGSGDCIGEISLLGNIKSTHTMIALEDSELLLTQKPEFTYVLLQYPPVLKLFVELFRIRRPDLELSKPFASANISHASSVTPPQNTMQGTSHDDLFQGRWVEVLLGLGCVFVVCTLLAIFFKQPIWNYTALLTGAFVGPITFVAFLRNSQLLGFRPSRLLLVFVTTALVAIPVAWILETKWLFPNGGDASFANINIPVAVAAIEEVAKLLICIWMLRAKRLRFLMDAVVFGAAAGMGFAAVETVIYGWVQLTNDSTSDLLAVLWVRALLSPFGHGTWTAIAAAGIWFGWRRTGKFKLLAISLPLLSIVLHTIWNYEAITGIMHMLIMFCVGIVGLLLLFWLIRRGRREEQQALVRINPALDDTPMSATLEEIDSNEQGEVQTLLLCKACGTQSPRQSRYCARCGHSLRLKRV